MATTRRQSGFLIQGNYGARGNFELVIPCGRRGMAHYWRANDTDQLPWHGPFRFDRRAIAATSLIQGTYGRRGNFEVVARAGSRLAHYWRNNDVSGFPWSSATLFGSGVAGNPSLIQGNFGRRGNFEVVVPRSGSGLRHYWRNNSARGYPWSGPTNFGSGRIAAAALIQGNYGRRGNFEVVAREGSRLVHYWRGNDSAPYRWHGPTRFGSGVTGRPALIQGSFGRRGNFEVVVPRSRGGLSHYWRANDTRGYPWRGPTHFGRGRYEEASLIQGNYGRNLEVVARAGATLHHYWRESRPPYRWHGPFPIWEECVRVHFKILTNPTTFTIDQMLAGMRQVYQANGFRVELVSTETLNLPLLEDVDVGACTLGSVTAEQTQLFANRNNVGANDVVIYFVRSTVPAYNGCASYPAGRPGAVVSSTASRWTLAHEIGHNLGLGHVNNNDRLMTGNGTYNITNPPPDLTAGEVNTMRASNLTPLCRC